MDKHEERMTKLEDVFNDPKSIEDLKEHFKGYESKIYYFVDINDWYEEVHEIDFQGTSQEHYLLNTGFLHKTPKQALAWAKRMRELSLRMQLEGNKDV